MCIWADSWQILIDNIAVEYNFISTDNIADVVVEYSKQINADLIAIMTQQELKLKEQFLGSTAEHIVNNAQVPVVSIRPTRTYRSESVTWRFND